MAILGIGIDIVKIERVEKALDRWGNRFVNRVLRVDELKRDITPSFVASRFAAKEAVVKALGTGFSGGIGFKEIEIYGQQGSPPGVRLYGNARERCKGLGVSHIHLSLSHEKDIACAMVILEGNPMGEDGDEVYDRS